MLPGMFTWKLAPSIVIVSLAACGSPQAQTEAPPLPEPEEVEESGSDEPEPAASESEAAEPEQAEPEETEPGLPEPPPKKQCAGLAKSTCQVTDGCAWSTTEDCIDQ